MKFHKIFREFLNIQINPDTFKYFLVFQTTRLLWRINILKPNKRFDVIHCEKVDLILTPLAGSSSVRHSLRTVGSSITRSGMPLAVLTRDEGLRMQSFFNKKVANANTIGKAMLLAQFTPLSPKSNIEDFLVWLEERKPSEELDKHLWSVERTIHYFDRNPDDVRHLNIALETGKIEALIGSKLSNQINTTESVSSYRPSEAFNPTQLSRARKALSRLI